jgi:enamine deaminase RidA (YjgF/YER057c/UK114 family)
MAKTGKPMLDGIGATEMLHIFISNRFENSQPACTGLPVSGYEARIVDGEMNEVPRGQVGRLAVRGPTGCRYLSDPEQQQKYVRDGWNLTGDSFTQDADGFFHFAARSDDMIISAGYNIAGPEVEAALLAHGDVAECAVIGVADEARGQIVQAHVVLNSGVAADEVTTKRLQDHVKAVIAPYKYPRSVIFTDTCPRPRPARSSAFRLRTARRLSPVFSQDINEDQHHDRSINPPDWEKPKGYANGMLVDGTRLYTGGQIGWNKDQVFEHHDFVGQLEQTLANIAAIVRAAGGEVTDIVRLTWFITDKKEYMARQKDVGAAYRKVMGRHFPSMSVIVVAGLIEDAAMIEIEATAEIGKSAKGA